MSGITDSPNPPTESLTTVADEARGRRSYRALVGSVIALTVIAFLAVLVQGFSKPEPPEHVMRFHGVQMGGHTILRLKESPDRKRLDVWTKVAGSAKPEQIVQELFSYNTDYSTIVGKKALLKRQGRNPRNDHLVGVEYEPKRKEYHVWTIAP